MSIKKIVFITLFLGIGLISYRWYFNCMKDHQKTLKEVGILMQGNVLDFYKKHQRYPNLGESAELMEKAGCINNRQKSQNESKNIKGEIYKRSASYDCDYGFMKIDYSVANGDLSVEYEAQNQPYKIAFIKGNSDCHMNSRKNGTLLSSLGCYQRSCLLKNLSH